MEYGDGEPGKIVNHKLMGKVIIVEVPKFNPEYEHKWTIRLKDGSTLLVDRRELEEYIIIMKKSEKIWIE